MACFVAAFVALAAAQIRPSCNMPQLWEARIISFDPNERVYHNRTSEYRVFGRYSYDGTYKRKRIFVSLTFFHFLPAQEEYRHESDPTERFDLLELYATKQVNKYLLDDFLTLIAVCDQPGHAPVHRVPDYLALHCPRHPRDCRLRGLRNPRWLPGLGHPHAVGGCQLYGAHFAPLTVVILSFAQN